MDTDISQPIPSHTNSHTETPQLPNSETDRTPSAKRQKTAHQTHPTISETEAEDSLPSAKTATNLTMSTSTSPPILESLQLEHLPAGYSVQVAVFKDVENAAFLHQQLLARNADFEYALIDAGVVTSRLQVLSAAFKAITAQLAGAAKTPNVHSEMVYALSPTNNISEAYRRHGISPTTRHLVIVKVLTAQPSSAHINQTPNPDAETTTTTTDKTPLTAQDVESHLATHVQGTPAPFTDETLSAFTDWGRVRKYYKLNGVPWVDGIKDQDVKNRELDMLVRGGMALRGV
ncbi:kinase binding protein CGI-121-domain-containing protein [Astrocystis sublimbata]|nr:kinase binding protein CGI-121-domain-containing protein [Astrocystis sublimbata]